MTVQEGGLYQIKCKPFALARDGKKRWADLVASPRRRRSGSRQRVVDELARLVHPTRPMRAYDLIRKKRDGGELSEAELCFIVRGATDGSIADEQLAAFLMAVFFRGMDGQKELPIWLDAMLHSGQVLDLSSVPGRKVDKHSTGGVGDKISLPLAPLVAVCGVKVPMVSGRGLGHTGGTLDKLESIPGFNVNLSVDKFTEIVNSLGLCLIGQTAEIAPADRKLYALRDATATVESIPLIASSILSKKLAEGIDALVLDVKVGKGAFMKSQDDARTLARTMVDLCHAVGRGCTALLTAMDEPLGNAVGNACEVQESIEILQNKGPADVRELTLQLGIEMLLAADADALHPNHPLASQRLAGYRARLEKALEDGSALERFAQLIEAQGGDRRVCDDFGRLPEARLIREVRATQSGVLQSLDAEQVGLAAVELGAGRARKEDKVDPAAGLWLLKKAGDAVSTGDVLAELHGETEARLDAGEARILEAARIGERDVARKALILERIA